MPRSSLENGKQQRGAWILVWALGGLIAVVLAIVAVMVHPSEPAPPGPRQPMNPPAARTVRLPGGLTTTARDFLPPGVDHIPNAAADQIPNSRRQPVHR